VALVSAALLLGLLMAVPASAQACPDYDFSTFTDSVPSNGGNTVITFNMASCDYGSYQVPDIYTVSYNDSKVRRLYSVRIFADSYADGGYVEVAAFSPMYEGSGYVDSTPPICYEPCRMKAIGWVSEYYDANSSFKVEGNLYW
jgi:hypothetical protein